MWRLVFNEDSNLTFSTPVDLMDWDTLMEANAALDLYITAKNKANRNK
ncbi:hypothetical protein [Fictibacillus sp. 18YEL24]|nr:hypothetical protein [Fictibacillus sp. 18YEL24]MBH0171020.1 hypothetical protein [Fictibacillus sp. 18YEL24]